jgi:mono/diheme cytochrome c family protein
VAARRDTIPTSTGILLTLALATAAAIFPARGALAFHEGGVGSCGGCHIMHEGEDGVPVVDVSDPLLRGDASSDVCLGCHGDGPLGVFGEDPLNPPAERGGGNFVFLLEDQINDAADGADHPLSGEAAGHSVVAPSRGVGPDSRWPVAPGGAYPSSDLVCTSCHDPHGNTNFRMLHGAGPIQDGSYVFSSPAPTATGIELTTSSPAESRSNHTAYLEGMSAWCGNCHGPDYHDQGTTAFDHPSNRALGGKRATRYGYYAGEDNPTSGDPTTSYLPEVPFEDSGTTTSTTAGPSGFSRVMCLTCHRAHASSAPAAGRWDFRVDRLDADGFVSGSYPLPNPYPGPNQGTLCSKCHPPDVPGSEPPLPTSP